MFTLGIINSPNIPFVACGLGISASVSYIELEVMHKPLTLF